MRNIQLRINRVHHRIKELRLNDDLINSYLIKTYIRFGLEPIAEKFPRITSSKELLCSIADEKN